MKGHEATPARLAEKIVRRVFQSNPPASGDTILYPGCGHAPFAAAVEFVCEDMGWDLPVGYAADTDPQHLTQARRRGLDHVEFANEDFLSRGVLERGKFDYIVGNPPYVPIEGLTEEEKTRYRANFRVAVGRFDLYLLFFEQALRLLAPEGRIGFVTPEKFEYVATASPLRRLLSGSGIWVEEIDHVAADSFTGLITYPCVTTVTRTDTPGNDCETQISLRDESTHTTKLPNGGESWASSVRRDADEPQQPGATLADITRRISAGPSTGADTVFEVDRDAPPESIDSKWLYRTVSGSQLNALDSPYANSAFVCPYTPEAELASKHQLGATLGWLEEHKPRLRDRTCVEKGKPWYAWHETPPLEDALQPKIVFQDLAEELQFWCDRKGTVVPKHSTYYLVPQSDLSLDTLTDYLHSPQARDWMKAHCQRAHNGYYRLQSRVLEDLPVPNKWAAHFQATLNSSF